MESVDALRNIDALICINRSRLQESYVDSLAELIVLEGFPYAWDPRLPVFGIKLPEEAGLNACSGATLIDLSAMIGTSTHSMTRQSAVRFEAPL